MDISKGTQTEVDIFRLIIDEGPLTLYSASTKSPFPLGTIHRHFKEMEKSTQIKVYGTDKNSRKKKPYGPTVLGFISFYDYDKDIQKNLENYFLLWIEREDFLSDLKENGFDVDEIKSNPNKSKELFRKFVTYNVAIQYVLSSLKKNPSVIPRQLSLFIGELLLHALEPSFIKSWEELYIKLPGLREDVDSHIDEIVKIQKRLKKKIHQ